MGFNLTNEFIDQSFQQLTQISGSELVNGTGSLINNLTITASQANSASYAVTASYALNVTPNVSASYAISASQADNANNATSASFASSATTASFALNFNPTATASYALFAENANSASYAAFAAQAQQASDLFITVKNTSGADIGKGLAVHATGVTGENVNIKLADSDIPADMPAIGLTETAILNNGNGRVIINGRLIGVDTSLLIAGSPVYVNGAGTLSATKPTGSGLIQNIGTAAKIDASDGEIILQGSGRTNDLPNLTTDYVWKGDANGVPQAVATSSIIPTTANTASYVAGGNVDGTVASATSASHAGIADSALSSTTATSASHAVNADTASFLPSSTRLNITDITASNATFTSASIGYLKTVTGSATIIGDEYIILNSDSPTKRFAGIKVYDSGSGLTGSFEWDSVDDNWIQVETGGESAGMLTGPSGSKGSEVYPTANTLIKGTGNHTVVDSSIVDNGTNVTTNLPISASGGITGSLHGNADTATLATNATNATSASHALQADNATTASYATNAGEWNGSYLGNASITGSLIVSGGNFDVLGATRNGSSIDSNFKQTVASPGSFNQYDLVAAGSGTIGSKNYTNRNFFFADYSAFGDQFKDYFSIEYYDSFSYNFGSEFNVNGLVSRIATTASGSGAASSRFSVIETRDNHDGTGQIRLSSGDQNKFLLQAGNQGIKVTGAVSSTITTLTISSNTASLDLQDGDAYILNLVSGSDTHLDASNVSTNGCQTVSVRVNQPAVGHGTISFAPEFRFAGGTAPTATAAANGEDILTFQTYGGTNVYGTAALNLS